MLSTKTPGFLRGGLWPRAVTALCALVIICQSDLAQADPAALLSQGDRQYRLQNLDAAEQAWAECLSEAEKTGDEHSQVLARLRLGQVALHRNNASEAVAILEPAKTFADSLDDKALLLNIVRVLFDSYAALDDKEKAIDLGKETLALAQHGGNQQLAFSSALSLAVLYDAIGDGKSANAMRSLYREIHGKSFAAALPQDTVRKLLAAGPQGQLDLAQQYADVGNLNKALEVLEQGHAAAMASNDRTREAFFLHNMFLVYAAWGDKTEAKRLCYRSREIQQRHALAEVSKETCAPAVEALLDLGLTKEAVGLGRECLPTLALERDDGRLVGLVQGLMYTAKLAGLDADAYALESIYLTLTRGVIKDMTKVGQAAMDEADRKGLLTQNSRESLEGKIDGLRALSDPEIMPVLLRLEQALNARRYQEASTVLGELRLQLAGQQRLFNFIVMNAAFKLSRSAQDNRNNLNHDLALEQYGAAYALLTTYASRERNQICTVRVSMAQVEAYLGNYLAAERLFLETRADIAPHETEWDALAIENMVHTGLGGLYTTIGRFDQAERELRASLGILAKVSTAEARADPRQAELVALRNRQDKARVLMMLGDLNLRQGRFAEAEAEYGKARKTILDEINPVARWWYSEELELAITGLGEVRLLMARGRLPEARKLLDRHIQRNQANYGPFANRQRLELILLQAKLDLLQGRAQNAHKILSGARAEMERSSGILHPFYAETSLLLAMAAQAGPMREAYLLEAADAAIRLRAEAFHVLSEWEKRSYSRQAHLYMDTLLSVLGPDSDQKALQEAYALWTRWKGGLFEEEARIGRLLSQAKGPEVERLTNEYRQVRAGLAANVRIRGSQIAPGGVEKLLARKAEIERTLARLNGDGPRGEEPLSAGVSLLFRALPRKGVFVDFARYASWDLITGKSQGNRYLAFVLDPIQASVRVVDMGPAEDIDDLIARFQDTLHRNRTRAAKDMAELASALSSRIIAPLSTFLRGREEILVSPDGPLHAIPFELLSTDAGFLGDRPLRYLTSAMDLVRGARQSPEPATAAIFADPTFSPEHEAVRPGDTLRGIGGTVAAAVDDTTLLFAPLKETRAEADSVRKQVEGGMALKAVVYLGDKASEDRLLSLRSPRLIHIATHSYAHVGAQAPEAQKVGLLDHLNGQAAFYPEEAPTAFLLLSGGAKSLKSGQGQGVVTPEKILSMGLSGTELVVLSSCLSAQGDIVAGQGVFGLTRAFLVAGAQSIVSSLWEVDSEKTIEFMDLFYTRLAETHDPARALQLARSDMRASDPNPYYWAAFVVTGGVSH